MSQRIHDIPEQDRPRERLLRLGPGVLSDAELLAIFINTGTKGENAIQVAQRLLRDVGSLRELSRQEPESLVRNRALGPAKAAHLAAAFELGRRAEREAMIDRPMSTPPQVYQYLGAEMQSLNQESVRVILLNARLNLMRCDEVHRGGINETIAHPRDILRKVIIHSAYAFILVHNHPSGDPTPSSADYTLTKRLEEICKPLGIAFSDHIIIGSPGSPTGVPYFSFREAGVIK
jgi:DNA repair protein RadC